MVLQERKRLLFFIVLFAVTLLNSCSTEKNTATRRFYHNLVSRYNIYYNGKETMIQAMSQLEQNHKDDYAEIISILQYGSEKDLESIIPLMERVSEKGSKIVLKHSMKFDGVEYNNWVKDAYLMIGKSRFFKHEYYSAIEMFDFIANNFNENQIRLDALLWKAKSNLYLGKYKECNDVLSTLESEMKKADVSV